MLRYSAALIPLAAAAPWLAYKAAGYLPAHGPDEPSAMAPPVGRPAHAAALGLVTGFPDVPSGSALGGIWNAVAAGAAIPAPGVPDIGAGAADASPVSLGGLSNDEFRELARRRWRAKKGHIVLDPSRPLNPEEDIYSDLLALEHRSQDKFPFSHVFRHIESTVGIRCLIAKHIALFGVPPRRRPFSPDLRPELDDSMIVRFLLNNLVPNPNYYDRPPKPGSPEDTLEPDLRYECAGIFWEMDRFHSMINPKLRANHSVPKICFGVLRVFGPPGTTANDIMMDRHRPHFTPIRPLLTTTPLLGHVRKSQRRGLIVEIKGKSADDMLSGILQNETPELLDQSIKDTGISIIQAMADSLANTVSADGGKVTALAGSIIRGSGALLQYVLDLATKDIPKAVSEHTAGLSAYVEEIRRQREERARARAETQEAIRQAIKGSTGGPGFMHEDRQRIGDEVRRRFEEAQQLDNPEARSGDRQESSSSSAADTEALDQERGPVDHKISQAIKDRNRQLDTLFEERRELLEVIRQNLEEASSQAPEASAAKHQELLKRLKDLDLLDDRRRQVDEIKRNLDEQDDSNASWPAAGWNLDLPDEDSAPTKDKKDR
ncbi:hypothetical protein H696_00485 [Fonticula alba]|uniref:Uncharacterized protein n=1 Tax=Fonticula alba TaxID=691883 RepID=A0A058ZG37_FONAL|nr:hypothetical protein H696_00485 [Fonticula alba]KCV72916.1 hypothetical protein H696_00485 [Fonticula alba]|eukprot:XP_009492617.1 hypothetical protein H696_00485 [Fonticula alba]